MRRLGLLLLAGAVVAGGAAAYLLRPGARDTGGGPSPNLPGDPVVLRTLPIPGGASGAVYMGDSIWTVGSARREGGRERLLRVDVRTGAVEADLPIGILHGGTAVGDGSLWVVNQSGACVIYGCGGGRPVRAPRFPSENSLFRVDLATNAVTARWAIGSPFDVAYGAGSIWVTAAGDDVDGSRLIRVDPRTGTVASTTVLPGSGAAYVTVGAGSVWVATAGGRRGVPGDWQITRVDASTGRVSGSIPVDRGAAVAIASGAGGIWVADGPGRRILSVDVTSAGSTSVVAEVPVLRIAAAAGRLWAVDGGGSIRVVDPAGGSVSVIRGVGPGADGVGAGPRGVWVSGTRGLTEVGFPSPQG